MEEVKNLSKTSWFLNPWFDILFLAGFPVSLLVIYLLNYLRLYFPTAFSLISSFWIPLLILPHFFSTFGAVYLDRQEWRGKPILFLWVPLALAIAIIIFSFSGYLNLFATILFCGVIWHILVQNCYILQIHKLRNQDYLRLDNIIDNIALIIGPVYLMLKSLPYLKFDFYGGTVYSISINLYILNYLRILTWLSIAAFTARQIYLFIKWRRVNIFKTSMIFMNILSFYYSLVLIKDVIIFITGVFRWHHNIQYILWVWFYHRKKFKEGVVKEARIISYLSQPHHARLYILSFMLVTMVTILVIKGISSLTTNPILTTTVILSVMGVLHIFFDSFIWKISKVHSIVNT